MTRSEARERLMQLFFQMEARKDYSTELSETYIKANFRNSGQKEYANELSNKIIEHLEDIDSRINQCADHWNTNRMPKMDLAVMRLAVGEIYYMDEIPDAVAVNEAVGLAGKFGTDESNKFVNGVLGKIISQKNG